MVFPKPPVLGIPAFPKVKRDGMITWSISSHSEKIGRISLLDRSHTHWTTLLTAGFPLSHKNINIMRSFMLTAACLFHALTALAALHTHGHKAAHHAHPQRREEELDEAGRLRKRELYERNKEAAARKEATNWIEPGFEGQQYVDDCTRHHNVHRRNHLAYDLVWDEALAYTAQLVAQSCNYAHDTSYDNGEAGQNIAAGLPASNVSGCISDLWYNSEYAYFSYNYGQPQPDYTDFEHWGHMTQIVWKATIFFGCATQYCPYGLGNAGSVDPFFTVCNYKEAGNVEGLYDQNVSPPQGALDVHWDQ